MTVVLGIIDRDLSIATRTIRGGSVFGIWPLNRYRRLELTGGVLQYNESFNDPSLEDYSQQYQQDNFGRTLFRSGTYVPLGINFVQETTIFREFGPLSGNTMRVAYEYAPKIGNTLSRQTADVDARYYARLGASGLLALRARGFRSWGDSPDFMYFGGNSEMRGYDYLQFVGDTSAFLNAELRFPLIEAMLTPVGVLGGIRGVFFANLGGGHFDGQPFKWFSNKSELYTPINGFVPINATQQAPVYGRQKSSTACAWWTRAPPTASASRPSRWASPFTSTGPGKRSSTRTGKTCSSGRMAEARRSGSRSSRSGLGMTSRQ